MQLIRSSTAYNGDPSSDPGNNPMIPQKESFFSAQDGLGDIYALSPPVVPNKTEKSVLIVYLHGMGSTCMEPYIAPKKKPIIDAVREKIGEAAFTSLPYRGTSSWLNKKALLDVDQNIRAVLLRYPVDRVILMGTSMGGCSVLAYSYLAAPDIKEKIKAVIACEPSGDLGELYRTTKQATVKNGIATALGGTPDMVKDEYDRLSILRNIPALNKEVKYIILSSKNDDVVPTSLQTTLVASLKKESIPVSLIEFEERHGVPDTQYYSQALDLALAK